MSHERSARATGTQPVDGDSEGGGQQLDELCANVLPGAGAVARALPWALPFLVTLRSIGLEYQSARREGREPCAEDYARRVLVAVQTKMDRWPVRVHLPDWLDIPLAAELVERVGVDVELTEPKLLEGLAERARSAAEKP